MKADGRRRSFAEVLDELCLRPVGRPAPYTDAELARLVNARGGNVTGDDVRRLRQGRQDDPTLQTLQDLAAVLGVSPAAFVGGRVERLDEECPRRSFSAKLRHLFTVVYPPGRGPYTPEDVAAAISAGGRYGTISAAHIRDLLTPGPDALPNPRLKHILGLAEHFGLADEDGPQAAYFLDDRLAAAIDAELADLTALRDAGVMEFATRVAAHAPAWSPRLRRQAVRAITRALESGDAGLPPRRERLFTEEEDRAIAFGHDG